MGKHISITGKIQKDNGINNNINYDISYLFKRNLKQEEINELFYQSGKVTIYYTDTIPGIELYKSSLNYLIDLYTDILNNLDTKLVKSINIYILEIYNDRSTCIANLLEAYIYQNSDHKTFTNIKEIENYSSIMEFPIIEKKNLTSLLDKSLKNLIKDLNKLL